MSSRNRFVLPVLAASAALGVVALTTAVLFAVGVMPTHYAEASPAAAPSDLLGVGQRVASLDGVEAEDKVPVVEAEVSETLVTAAKRAKAPVPKPKVAAKPSRSAAPSRATASATGWQSAKASWYGPGFYGRRTASGAVLTEGMMNVAHKSLPFGTRIQFEYKGRTATAVVNDRGPYIHGRVFDLGPGTAQALGFGGVGMVKYRILGR
ncbi:MAG: RlpA-like double-psi beta-barrel domain-containing protein [Anaerosomatales bacterium]|nr:RlpA-like double-psi beta-barrel domain-containing protein [Anaerosomatales bacterium]MDT8433660.1 RlpA-like double-psi beta-barrel domain-containing protein [Anaerosomatales bacterium]